MKNMFYGVKRFFLRKLHICLHGELRHDVHNIQVEVDGNVLFNYEIVTRCKRCNKVVSTQMYHG